MSIRRREMAAVLAHVREGVSVEVRGSWGSGRSALLRGVERAARDEGFDIIPVAGEFALRTHALGALDVAGVRPPRRHDGSAVSARIDEMTGRVLARPTLILVDDAASVDPESWGVISSVQRRTDVSVVYVLDAHAPQGPGAVHVLERRVARVVLEPLRYEEVRSLLEDILGGGVDANTVGRVFSKSGGLPRLVVAVGRTGRQQGILSEQAGAWHAGDDLWHPALAPHVTEILYPLSPALREGLETLALAGIVALDRCVRLIGSPLLEQLEARGLISVFRTGARVMVAVNPPLIAEYYRHQPISARRVRLVERALSEGDEREGAAAVEAAAASSTWGRARPAALEWEAVRNPAVARLIGEHRREEASRAVDEWREHPGRREALAVAEALAPDAGAGPVLSEALRDGGYSEAEPRVSLALLAHRANLVVRAGVVAPASDHGGSAAAGDLAVEIERVMREAREQLPAHADAIDAIGLEAEVRACGFAPRSEHLVRELIDRFDARGLDTGAFDGGVDEGRVALAEVLQAKGWFARALRLLEIPTGPAAAHVGEPLGETLGGTIGGTVGEPRPDSLGGSFGGPAGESAQWRRRRQRVTALALFGAGRIDEMVRRSAEWRDAALAELDSESLLDQAYASALALVHTGRNAEADDAIGAALALGEPGVTSGDVYGAILVLGAIVAARRGAIEVADTLGTQARRWLPLASPLPLAAVAFADAHSAHARGDDDSARLLLAAAHDEFTRRGFAVQAAIAEVLALEILPDAAAVPRSAVVEGDLFGPLLDYLRGVGGAEADWIEQAGDRLRGAQQTVHAAGAYLRAADAYRLAARFDDADRVDRLAQALGASLDPDVLWHVRAQAASRPALTQREREITALAAAGISNQHMANRLSVSVRTIENHLNRAFRKLGISRRDELETVRTLWTKPTPD